MANTDNVLRFVLSTDSNVDMRTFRVLQVLGNPTEELEVYKFSHPLTGHSTGTTTFHRKNLDTSIFETAGHVEWFSSFNATVCFGVDETCAKQRMVASKFPKPTVLARCAQTCLSRSRRFKASGMEYKWKLGESGTDMLVSVSEFRSLSHVANTNAMSSVSTRRTSTWQSGLERIESLLLLLAVLPSWTALL
ncbi:hypothetical protein JVT61DRAFT_12700 [Boletus reticuloceps]|uniref:Uncharacterized protein n=1 Tax=Boletus reticuloceps TaxID=495285 RepID=A0A8I2YTT0_9AGAM|nr:hypothetical protein JVT61DRAFT_12700 [Boletus reticuloceps]